MSIHSCANEKCAWTEKLNIPAYSLEARTVQDIQEAIKFANKYDIPVSVKSSGHSYQSQSMHVDSLLIWVRNFPVGNTFTQDFVDSCGTHHGTTMSVAAGENFESIVKRIKDGQYNVVTGVCGTVCLSGGFVHGIGLSELNRYYGHGIDQAKSFDVVLADGSLVTADACSEPDLFWALRGGGGGNWGVVTNVEYKVHPQTPITRLKFTFPDKPLPIFPVTNENTKKLLREWTSFWVRNLPTAEIQWAGALFSPFGASFIYLGSREEAAASPLIRKMDTWYDNLTTLGINPGFSRPSSNLREYPNFYESKGGENAFGENDPTNPIPPELGRGFSRMIPMSAVVQRTDELIELIVNICIQNGLQNVYWVGGRAAEVPKNITALHPGVRDAVFGLEPVNDRANQQVLKFAGNQVAAWSVSYNHHDVREKDWENVLFGSHYPRLQEIKARYDPKHRFNVYHGVNYKTTEEMYKCGKGGTQNVLNILPFFLSFLVRILQTILGAVGIKF
jgi:hypothetical protein